MLALVLAVLTMSLLGGLHCAGMCGAFVTLAVNPLAARPASPARLQFAYHAGRLIVYALLGAAAGAAGATVDLGARALGLQQAATAIAASFLLVFGLATLLRGLGLTLPALRIPAPLAAWAAAGHRLAWRLDPAPRALAIGLLTALLPCGWLYTFAITAAGTAHPASAALVMAVFWIGTLPWLAAVGAGSRLLLSPLGGRAPILTALLLIAVAAVQLSGRITSLIDPARAALAADHCGPPTP